jgi:hypothetical protein
MLLRRHAIDALRVDQDALLDCRRLARRHAGPQPV